MAVQGFSAGDFAALSKFAYKVYSNVRESRANFVKLNLDVESLLVSVGSLDRGHTQQLVAEYIDDDDDDSHLLEVRALRDGLNSTIMPFYALFETNTTLFRSTDGTKSLRPVNRNGVLIYVDGPTTDIATTGRERPWRRWPPTSWIQRLIIAFELKDLTELRSRFAVQAANLNLFLTRLTHRQLQRQTELLTLKLAEQSLLRDNFRYSLDLSEASHDFRQDVGSYIKFLLDGGKPYTDSELQRRKTETRYLESASRTRKRLSQYSRTSDHLKELESRGNGGSSSKLSSEEVNSSETPLDDDARLKLAAARQRLLLAEIKDDQSGAAPMDPDPMGAGIAESLSMPGDWPTLVQQQLQQQQHPPLPRRRSDMPEQIITPRPAQRPKELSRRASSAIVCDICDRTILSEKAFYRCESGRCGGISDSFDVCRRCYLDGENCPGYHKGLCGEMNKVVWKEID